MNNKKNKNTLVEQFDDRARLTSWPFGDKLINASFY